MSDITLLELYIQILEDLGLTVNNKGEVLDGKGKPLMITFEGEKRPLVVPSEEQRRRSDSYNVLYFHPACESLARGRSEVLNAMALIMAGRIHLSALLVTHGVLEFGSDKDAHKKAPQRKAEILFKLPTISKPTMAAWKQLMPKLTPPGAQGKKPLLRLCMDRSVEMSDGSKFKRSCTIKFPILETSDYYEPGLTKIANEAIGNALRVVLGDEEYTTGSNSNTAPYLDALLRNYHAVMTHIHDIADRVSPYLTGERAVPEFDGSWIKDLDRLGELYKRDLNMTLDGNQGRGGDEEPEVAPPVAEAPAKPRIVSKGNSGAGTTTVPPAPSTAPTQPARQPAAQPAGAASSGVGAGTGLSLRGRSLRPAQPARAAEPVPQPQQQYQNVAYDKFGNPIDPRTGYPLQQQGGYYDPRGGYVDPRMAYQDPRFAPQPTYDPRFPQPQQPNYDPRFAPQQPVGPSGYYDANGVFHYN